MAENKTDILGVESVPPPLPADPPPAHDERRKSLSFTTSWSSQPSARKYSLNDAPPCPLDIKGIKEIEGTTKPGNDQESKRVQDQTDQNAVEESNNTSDGSKPDENVRKEIVFVHKDPKPVPKNVEKTKKVNETPAGTSSMPPTPNTAMKMSCMEEEAIRERLRTLLLRQTAEILETEGVGVKFTKDTFRRTFLNKEILSRLFQLFDQDRDNQLVQEQWIEFLKERLT